MSETNSLLHPVNELHFGSYDPNDVPAALAVASSLAEQRIADIAAIPHEERGYDNTVLAMQDAAEELDLIYTVARHLSNTLGSEWRDAENLASAQTVSFATRLEQDTELYEAVKHVQQRAPELDLTEAQKRSLKHEIASFERNGVNADPQTKERLKEIKASLAELQTLYRQNMTEAEEQAYLPVQSVADLEGVDSAKIDTWKDEATSRGLEGYAVTLDTPSYWAIAVGCKSEKIRRSMHKLMRTLAPENESVATEILALRKEMAQLLGRTSFAEYVTETRMVKTEENARNFVEELTSLCLPGMHRETAELTAFIEKTTGKPYQPDIIDFDSGNDLFYADQLKKELTGDETINVSEYFPLEHVQEQLFATMGTLYGVTFRPSSQPVWHEDVKAYDIIDEQGNHISTVWCDWLARKGKRSDAWMKPAYVADRSGGKTDEPHFAFVHASFPRPTKDKPSLLSFNNVISMWHEFGHVMHSSLSKTELRSQHSSWSKWDFIEAPSQIMENWPWQPEILAGLAKHYKTGESLPPEFLQNMQRERNFRVASKMLWMLYLSSVDLYLHSKEYDSQKDGTPNQVARRIKQRFIPAPVAEYDNSMNTFGHPFAGAYASSVHGYPWAEAIEADLFSRFKREGILNADTGRDYRDELLAQGDEKDPEVLMKRFLGRPFNSKALLERMGLAA